jgi:hypothetical protein
MTARIPALAAVLTLALPAAASAASTGPYSGTSVNKGIYRYGDLEPRTDKGTVTFKVGSGKVTKLRFKGQQIMCGASPFAVPVAVAKIKLNSAGRGTGTYTNANVGSFTVKIKVGGNGKASGTVIPTGLCRGKVSFSAKRT